MIKTKIWEQQLNGIMSRQLLKIKDKNLNLDMTSSDVMNLLADNKVLRENVALQALKREIERKKHVCIQKEYRIDDIHKKIGKFEKAFHSLGERLLKTGKYLEG